MVYTYNYGIHLENGTQINKSICEEDKVIINSIIADKSLIKFEEAKYFDSLGYDIYHKNSSFYIDIFPPASNRYK